MSNIQAQAERFKLWRERPDIFVEEVFKVTPDLWQRKVLQAFPTNQRLAMKACRGPGKTCVLAWLAWNFLLTRPNPMVMATSITADTLSDTLWREMSKWQQRSPLLMAAFTWTKTVVESKERPSTWFMAARPWSKSADAQQQASTLGGRHEDYMLFILDEAGGIPETVMVAAEAALSSCIEGHIVIAGNPTHREGPLFNACTKQRAIWHITEISSAPDDPNRTPRVSIQWAQEQIDSYGRDSPWVIVNIFGDFPPTSFNALIGSEEVEASMKRLYAEQDYCNHSKVLGIDVARDGADSSVILPRQGLQMFRPMTFRNINGTEGANHAAKKWKEWGADGAFVDGTGGFGSSWVDNLIRLGFAPISVHFSSKPSSDRYFNKRTEMIFDLVEWVKRGGALPNTPELVAELSQSTYTFKGDKLLIEPKEMLKAKIGRSPDTMDAAALTFAAPVAKAPAYINGWPLENVVGSRHTSNYHPLSRAYLEVQRKDSYHPLKRR